MGHAKTRKEIEFARKTKLQRYAAAREQAKINAAIKDTTAQKVDQQALALRKLKQRIEARIPQATMAQFRRQSSPRPCIPKGIRTNINTNATGQTSLLAGVTNKVCKVSNLRAISKTGAPAYKFVLNDGSTDFAISDDDTNNKAMNGEVVTVLPGEELFFECTALVNPSTVDVTGDYEEEGWG